MRTNNRWVIAIAGVFFQIALGAVYAWSVFRVPLTKQFGWSISQVTLTFTISIFVLGFAAFFGGLWLNRKGPRIVALTGGVFYGVGVWAWVSDLITRCFQRGRSVVHRPYAGNDRFLCRGVARHRRGDGNFNSAAGYVRPPRASLAAGAVAQKKFA
jgi:hypothetical protein